MLSTIRRALGQLTSQVPPLSPRHFPVVVQLGQDATIQSSSVLGGALEKGLTLSDSAVTNPRPLYLTIGRRPPPSDNVVELEPSVFAHPIRRDILHLCVVHYLDSLRQGTASTKTRGEVRGSGRKIRPQKGTGRARLGVAFGPKPRDFSTKLNRKVIQMGMRAALSARVKEQCFGVVESLQWPSAKTKELSERIDELGWRKTLFVTGEKTVPDGLQRASSNIHKLETMTAEELKVYHVVKWPRLVLDLAAVEYFERTLAKPIVPRRVYT
ncbi:ribosomal protein L4 domain-containing protein [Amylocystis lapponica]|nr:ribosomal protein L4 domain-containing protein [Amylocystis lapponica]